MFEKLKTSRRLQVEVALAGLVLWKIKRDIRKRNETHGSPSPPAPVTENVKESTVFVYAFDVNDDGEPGALKVGSVEDDRILSVQGVIRAKEFIVEGASESTRAQLIALKRQIKTAGTTLQERAKNTLQNG